jgi:galactokinase
MSSTIISSAPARICLFGDHQDYLGLPVIACAINRHLEIRAIPIEDKAFLVKKINFESVDRIPFEDLEKPAPLGDYLRLSLQVLRRYGCIPDHGYEIEISSSIPINAGLSSSSALTIAWTQFLLSAFGVDRPRTPDLLIQLSHEIEVLEQGTAGGKMDHHAIVRGNMIYLDTTSEEVLSFTPPPIGLVVGVSGDPKQTSNILATRKEGALLAIQQIKTQEPDFQLAETEPHQVDRYRPYMDANLWPFFEAAVLNHAITQQALQSLQTGDFDPSRLGSLMNEHHQLLKNNLHITTPKIDSMIAAALEAGAHGAKIVGSGGGGCMVTLVSPEQQENVTRALLTAGALAAFPVKGAQGAKIKQQFHD